MSENSLVSSAIVNSDFDVSTTIDDADLDANLDRLLGGFSGIKADYEHLVWSFLYMPVHGTTIDRFESIMRDNKIYSYAECVGAHPEIVEAKNLNATGDLDIALGLDKYVFLNIGRVHPSDIQEVYICFSNSLIDLPGNLVALKEIVHYGAIVSQEAASFWRELEPQIDVMANNRTAAREFSKTLVRGTDFHGLFALFLQKNYQNILNYTTDLLFAGDSSKVRNVHGFPRIFNGWEGPQLKVPGSISLDDAKCILVVSEDKTIVERVRCSGFPRERIYSLSDVLTTYDQFTAAVESLSKFHFYVNFALRDLALMGANNRFSETWQDLRVGF